MTRITANTAITLITMGNAKEWKATDEKFLFVDGLIQDHAECPWTLTSHPEQFSRLVDRIEDGFELLLG